MFSRPVLFVAVLLAAVAIPYVVLDDQLGESVRGGWNRLLGKAAEEKDALVDRFSEGGYSPASVPTTGPAVTIEQAFRFDLTPQWVSGHWPQVSTVAGLPEQLGMRVALVSGTQPDDVAGSLTYFFDAHHQLQRITFSGLTRDPRRVLAATVTPYHLKSQPTTGAAYYLSGDPREPTSEVRVEHLPVLTSDSTAARAEVTVDLRRANARGSSQRAASTDDDEPKILPSIFRRW
jgi:uncharacterized protein DUF6690